MANRITAKILSYIKIATQAEVDAGVNDTKAVTPKKLANYAALNAGGLTLSDWNASTNTPALSNADTGSDVIVYRVSVTGSTNLSGYTSWEVGDLLILDTNNGGYIAVRSKSNESDISTKQDKETDITSIPLGGIMLTSDYSVHINGEGSSVDISFNQTSNNEGRKGGIITVYNATAINFIDSDINPSGLSGVGVDKIATIVYTAINGTITAVKVVEVRDYDITAPTITDVEIDGTTMTVTFDEAVTVSDTVGLSLNGDLSEITVTSYDSGSGTASIVYTVSAEPGSGDVGSLVYASANIYDSSGNQLADGSTLVDIISVDPNLTNLYLAEDNVNDSSGNGNTLTVSGGTLAYSADAAEGTKAFDVPGSTEGLLPNTISTDFSYVASIKIDLSQADAAIGDVLIAEDASGTGFEYITVKSDGTLSVKADASSQDSAAGVISTNTYHRVALTYDNTTSGAVKAYVDGVEVISSTGFPTGWTRQLKLWKTQTFNGTSYTGLMDNVKIFDKVLTPAEVATS